MAIEEFSVGSIQCRLVSDGSGAYPIEQMFVDVPEGAVRRALAGKLNEEGQVVTALNCLLVRVGDRVALIDTGLGATAAEWGLPAGRLRSSLSEAGVAPEHIDLVIVSHAHPDHIGGTTDRAGGEARPAFPNARYWFWADEWEFWTSGEGLSRVPDLMADPARAHLPALREVIELADQEIDVLPGVRLVPAPGHTPGHMVVALTSGHQGAIYIGDAMLHELNFEHPEWVSVFDALPGQTVQTRQRLLDRAVRENRLVIPYHVPVPGWVAKEDGGYRYRPEPGG